jgi:hypothetical protein
MSRPAVLKFTKILENNVAYERNLAEKRGIKHFLLGSDSPEIFSEGV